MQTFDGKKDSGCFTDVRVLRETKDQFAMHLCRFFILIERIFSLNPPIIKKTCMNFENFSIWAEKKVVFF